jgi:hypothetical protein
MKGLADAIVAKAVPVEEDEGASDKKMAKEAKMSAVRTILEGVTKGEADKLMDGLNTFFEVCSMYGSDLGESEESMGNSMEYGKGSREAQ